MGKIALIPAYEPNHELIEVVKDLRERDYECLVIDDGSEKERFGDIFKNVEVYANIIRHEINKGKGTAIKTGLKHLMESPLYSKEDVIVTVDADGQHRIEDIVKVEKEAGENSNALVLGTREFVGKVPLRSRIGNMITSLVFYATSGIKLCDTQTGLRGFKGDLIPLLLQIEGSRYEYEMNVLLYAAKNEIQLIEVPIETVYLNSNKSSHFNAIIDSARIYREIIRYSISSLFSFCVDYLMYALLFALTKELIVSNLVARVFSASLNYTINHKYVFVSKVEIKRAALRYTILAVGNLLVNTVILTIINSHSGLGAMTAKLVTEIIMFVLNFIIQRTVVFS